MLVTI